DPDGTIRSWNAGAEALFGYPAGETRGRTIFETIVPVGQMEEQRRWREAAAEAGSRASEATDRRKAGSPLRARRKDGAEFLVEISLSPLEVDGHRLVIAVIRDMSARRSERARSTEMIRNLTMAVDQSPAVIFITDPHGTIEYVNARFTEITGYSPAEAVGANPRLLKSGNTPPETYHALWKRLREGGVWRGEIQNRRKNGALYWDAATISPIRDEKGIVTHFLAIQQDITERKRIERDLLDREERFRELAENISEVFYIVDADFRETLYVNPAYEKLWGMPRSTIYEQPMSFLAPIHEEDRPRLLANIARVRAGEDPGSLEFRILPRDGREMRWVLSHAVPVCNDQGEVYRIAGFALDITDRRRAQEALLTNERRLRALFETVSMIVLVLDADGNIEYLNPFALTLTGYSLTEVLGRSWFELFLPESIRSQTYGVFHDLMDHNRHIHNKNVIATRTGELRNIAWHNTVLRDEQGRSSGTLSVGEDVTEYARLEEQYLQAQKMEAVGRLAGGVAHDFNNLLTIIMSYGELLWDGLPDADPRHEDVAAILKAAGAAAGLTRQLLAFSRQQVIHPRPVKLEDVVAESGRLLARVIGEDIELHFTLGTDPSTVLIDPGQLEQVIMNLVVNARDAMPGGGRLTIETSVTDLDEDYARTHWPAIAGRYAVLAVSDTGVGMTEEVRARIFEPFFTTKEAGKGTGLGLSTVYGIIKQSAGSIWVYSEPGRGTTFKIHLPLVNQASSPLIHHPVPGEIPRGVETILLVEDSAAVRAVARRILERFGYTVLEALSGQSALDLASKRAGSIDLLLTDVVMPEMSGRELTDRFKDIRPATRILYMSGYTDDAVVRHGILDTGVAYLQKPFTPEEMARKVRQVLDAPAPG
ncbi:MAG TPA: PAS domain S-box protein, partial [Gemmatimonadales bacterium]|nr:PAS domain S-box protein [Gemmatimonadales bacterium]